MSLPEQSVTPPRQRDLSTSGGVLPFWLPPLFYLLLACVFLWRSLFTGEVFLPAGLLAHVAPYSALIHSDRLPPWNPLRWDGIAEFYPWRHFASSALHAGAVPLWNPYQFCGTPFVANSQSAVFYPGNLLFYLLPTARAFGCSALLHLTLAGWFLYLLCRRMGCTTAASLLGGSVYAYSAWQVSWLQLPTFLATSCWFPLLLRQVYEQGAQGRGTGKQDSFSLKGVAGLGAVVGLLLLAGHLQVAFYGLLAGILWAFGLLAVRGRRFGMSYAMRMLTGYLGGLGLGLMLAAPQLLPTVELSRYSHRVGNATAEGYAAYTEYALPTQSLVTLVLPNFYGNDYDTGNVYWGFYVKNQTLATRHNAAETALYVGIAPLLLGAFALWRGKRDPKTVFFACLAALALLLALGTPVNALFYFGIPGFGQSGSPARALVLWTLALALLAAFGLDRLRALSPTWRELAGSAGSLACVFAVGLSLAAQALSHPLVGFRELNVPSLEEALGRISTDEIRLAIVSAGSVALFIAASRLSFRAGKLPLIAPAAVLLVVLDLFSTGILSNPTSLPEWVYPETGGIRYVSDRIGHERIFPVNQMWSLLKAPAAVLPPNGAMVYALRDVQGYDSLLTGQYKAFANRFARLRQDGTQDASPPVDGNIVFFQNPNSPLVPETGAAFALTLPPNEPEFVRTLPPSGSPVYADEMAVYALPNTQPRARLLTPDGSSVPNARIAYVEDGPTRVTLDVDTGSQAALTLADQFYPGWQATLDGNATRITRSTLPGGRPGIGRVVSTPAGRHRIAFRYEPASYRLGLYLACLALLVLAASTAFNSRRK